MTRISSFLLVLFLAAPTLAQNAATTDIESEGRKPAAAEAVQKSALEAFAGRLGLADDQAAISYEDVLAKPDDVDLNYGFARQQVRRGDLKGAAATLQRILLVNPDLPRVRLFYAVVLYRLDDLTEAQLELQRLSALKITDDVRKELDGYLDAIAKRQKRDHLSGQLGIGWEFDDNRNASPASGRYLFLGTPINASSPRTDDTSALFLAGVEERHTFSGNNEAFVSLNYFRAEQTQLKNLNLQAYSLTAGDSLRTPWDFTVKPSAIYNHVLLAQSTFLRDRGADIRVERKISQSTLFFADLRDVYSDYVSVPSFLSAHDFTGMRMDLSAGAERVLSPRQKVTVSADYGVKHSLQNAFAYNHIGLDVSHMLLLPRGIFLVTSLDLGYDHYPHADAIISPSVEIRADASMSAVLPLSSCRICCSLSVRMM